MSTNDRKGSNKTRDKSVTGNNKPQANAVDKPEINKPGAPPGSPQPKRKPKAERPKPKVVPEANKSDPDSYRDEHTTSEIKDPTSEIKSPTSEMEVHHHPQLEHKPKPWKEYLLEGFMIFIAVMMGFIAENIREDITNSEHARQLTLQLVHDLKSDTAQLNYIYGKESQIVKYNDTLFNLLQQPLNKADTRRIQKLAANSHSMWPFHPSAGAIGAIKNELHLKQFSNSNIITYFSGYESSIELLHTAQDINLQYQRTYLDPFITLHFTPANMVAAFSKSPVPNAQMRNLTQGDLDQLAANIVLIRIVSKEMVRDNRELEKEAEDMLRYVIKHFELKDE